MENVTGLPTNDLAAANQMFADYKTGQQKNKKKTSEEILAKYFEPRKSKEYFRILPPKDGKQPYENAYFHVIDHITSGGKLKRGAKVYCPAHNDPKVPKRNSDGSVALDPNNQPIMVAASCPICDKAKKLLSKQDNSLKGIRKENMTEAQKVINEANKKIFTEANKFEAKKFYVLRGIDKGAEKDGVKFWRFKHNYLNQGTWDKLIPVLQDFVDQNSVNFFDGQNGTDLSITVGETMSPAFGTYKTITAITARGKSPLNQDPIIVRQWLEDNITWKDVYTPKKAKGVDEHRTLELIAEGNMPYWDDSDQNNKHWVFPNHPDLQEAANTRTANLDADEDYSEADEDTMPMTNQSFDAGVDMGATTGLVTGSVPKVSINTDNSSDDINDLPF